MQRALGEPAVARRIAAFISLRDRVANVALVCKHFHTAWMWAAVDFNDGSVSNFSISDDAVIALLSQPGVAVDTLSLAFCVKVTNRALQRVASVPMCMCVVVVCFSHGNDCDWNAYRARFL